MPSQRNTSKSLVLVAPLGYFRGILRPNWAISPNRAARRELVHCRSSLWVKPNLDPVLEAGIKFCGSSEEKNLDVYTLSPFLAAPVLVSLLCEPRLSRSKQRRKNPTSLPPLLFCSCRSTPQHLDDINSRALFPRSRRSVGHPITHSFPHFVVRSFTSIFARLD